MVTQSRIVDANGNPIAIKQLAGEPQTARLAALSSEYADHPTRGLSPAKLAALYLNAEQGDLTAQAQLAEDMEEKDAHLFAELNKRRLAWLTRDWRLLPPPNATPAEMDDTAALEALLRDDLDMEALLHDLSGAILPGYGAVEIQWQNPQDRWLPTLFPRPADWFMVAPDARDVLRLRDGSATGQPLRPLGWIIHQHPAKSGYLTRAGLVRVLGWPFLFRNLTARDFAEFLEIYGLPLRLGRYPNGASAEEKATLMSAVVNIGHAAAGILPEGMSIEFQQAATGAADPFLAMMHWAEQAISKAVLGGTLTSQVDGKGSYAAAQTHNEVRGDILKADLRLVAKTLNRDLIAPLARLNTRLTRLPRLVFDLADSEDLTVLADALPKLVQAGVQIPARWVHEQLAIPEPIEGEPVLGAPAAPAAVATAVAATAQPVAGCQCPGCTGVAALAAGSPASDPSLHDAMDQAVAAEMTSWQAVLAPMVNPIQTLFDAALNNGETAEQLLARLPDALTPAAADALQQHLAQLNFAARLAAAAGLEIDVPQ